MGDRKTPEEEVEFQVLDEQDTPVEFKYVPVRRDDVSQIYFKKTVEKDLGFDIRIPYVRDSKKDRTLVIQCENKSVAVKLNADIIEKQNSSSHKKSAKLKSMMNKQTCSLPWIFLWKTDSKRS